MISDKMNSYCKKEYVLILIGLIYTYLYLSHPALPGNNVDFPLGWWGWFDQGEYFKATKALHDHNMSPDLFFYPPLYSMLGSIFYGSMSLHAFYFINLISLLVFLYFFLKFAESFIGLKWSIIVLISSLFYKKAIFEDFIIPWTTTPAAAFIAVTLYILYLLKTKSLSFKTFILYQACFTFISGMLIPLRPLDSVIVFVSLYPFYVYLIFIKWFGEYKNIKKLFIILSTNFIFGFIGLVIFFGFNYLITSDLLGNYFNAASANGFAFLDIFEKFSSLFVDSYNFYFVKDAMLLSMFPWLYLSLFAVFYFLIFGEFFLKALSTLLIVYVSVYISYNDLLITGLWRFHNIHYFKWMFPYAAFIGFYFIYILYERYQKGNKKYVFITLVIFGSFCLAMNYQYKIWYLNENFTYSINKNKFEIENNTNKLIDGIDIYGSKGSFHQTYFGEHVINIDGKRLSRVKDFRIIQMPEGIRIIFIRPIDFNKLTSELDKGISLRVVNKISLIKISYSYENNFISKPEINPALTQVVNPNSNYNLKSLIEFSKIKTEKYLLDGWSVPEKFGRWSNGSIGKMKYILSSDVYHDLKMKMKMGAFLNGNQEQKVSVYVNGVFLKRFLFDLNNFRIREYEIVIPGKIIDKGEVNLEFKIAYPAKPSALGMGEDQRLLGIVIQSLSIDVTEGETMIF